MKTCIDIIAYIVGTEEKRLLRKMEIDTNKIKAELTPKQKSIFDRIVERLGLKGKELSEAQEEAILFMALHDGRNPDFIENIEIGQLRDIYRFNKRIEKNDVKGLALLLEILENIKDEGLKSRLFGFIVWSVIMQDYFLHRLDDICGFGYASVEEMITTYAQVLGVSTDEVSSAIEGLENREAIVEGKGIVTLNFPFKCFEIEGNKELQKELKKDEWIDTADGVYYIPQPFAALYE